MKDWKSIISDWSRKNDRDPSIVEGILLRNGWDPSKFDLSMKDQLIDYLDQWYTLSIKELPEPATKNLRRNPYSNYNLISRLKSGWTVLTRSNSSGTKFKTSANNKILGLQLPTKISRSRAEAFLAHDDYAEDLVG